MAAIELAPNEQLKSVWETKKGIGGWLGTTDHKEIGKRYIITAFIFFGFAGAEAMLMRTQLIEAENTFLTPDKYDEFMTMHGVTMIFLFATPILSGFANFFVPLLIGARDMAFPRLNAFSYWVLLFSGMFIYASMPLDAAPNAGWFNYTPLSGPTFSPGLGDDFYCLGLLFLGISTTAGAINLVVSILTQRAPGMSINRMPLFCWNILVTEFMIVFAYQSLAVGLIMLELDRRYGTHFFDADAGGRPLLWQHIFWIFGHPDVYIIFLPAAGFVSEIIPHFSRRPIVGHNFVALATIATGILGFGVWVHHMFATGLPQLGLVFFSSASFGIIIPAGIQITCWLATVWTGRPVFTTAYLFVLAFIVVFTIGGITGAMFPIVPVDWELEDSYFIVAHFHYVLFGGMVFPLFGAFYYWMPKMTGRLLNEKLGYLNFWLIFAGFNLAFLPMHINGLLGMPRRVYTYPANVGWQGLNTIETIGAYIIALGMLTFVWNVIHSVWFANGEQSGPNPWDAGTLEWSVPSPPPPYNFAVIPAVGSTEPLWENSATFETKLPESQYEKRETPSSTLLDANLAANLHMPEDSGWPFVLGVALLGFFAGLLSELIIVTWVAAAVAIVAIVGWTWPGKEEPH